MIHKGWHSRGYLPHLDAPGVIQAVTFRLADSLPADVLERLNHNFKNDPAALRRGVAQVLDAGHGTCLLRAAWAAELVEQALLYFDGTRYRLLAWVVMPNHVHCVVEPADGFRLGDIVQSWKQFTARTINARRGDHGRFWQKDYFDRRIRDDRHLAAAIQYVENNPVSAGLVTKPTDWSYSSARER